MQKDSAKYGLSMYRKSSTIDYVVVLSPIGKMAKIDRKLLHILPRSWEVIPKTNLRLYRVDGGLQEPAAGMVRIKNKADIHNLSNVLYYDYGMMLGKLSSL